VLQAAADDFAAAECEVLTLVFYWCAACHPHISQYLNSHQTPMWVLSSWVGPREFDYPPQSLYALALIVPTEA
jgi:hypothetical protein